MQAPIEISHRNAPYFAFTNLSIEDCCSEIEFGGSFERQTSFQDVPFVLGRIERDCHEFIVYAICPEAQKQPARRSGAVRGWSY